MYPMRVRRAKCCDCGKEFETRAANAKRCENCRQWNGSPKKRTPQQAKEQQ